jgi:HlyD family secretion protein
MRRASRGEARWQIGSVSTRGHAAEKEIKVSKFVIALVVIAVAAAGGWYWYQSGAHDGEVSYRVAKVERGPMASVVMASGTLNAVATVQVSSQISGQVKDIYADFNTPVKNGQVLARIDSATYELHVSQARADLDAAENAASAARAELAAQQAMLEKARTMSHTTRQQIKAMQARIRASRAQVQSARAAIKQRESVLRQAQIDLERTIIRAPVDGTVILRNVDAGQTVAASLQAPVLFTIARDLREMQVEAAIDEANVGRLKLGLPATFAVDAFPRRSFEGEIRQIRKSPQNVQKVVSYTVVISAQNPDMALLPGMTANVRIVVESRDSALKVPNAALRWRPPQDQLLAESRDRGRAAAGRVWIVEGGQPKPVVLRLGLTDGSSTELVGDALAEGSEVIIGIADGGRASAGQPTPSGLPRPPFF